jgi:hypothetical protein
MYTSDVSAGDTALASQYNNLRKDAALLSGDDIDLTYTGDQLTGVVHNDFTVTYVITYTGDGLVSTVTDGVNTWTYTYTGGKLTNILKS